MPAAQIWHLRCPGGSRGCRGGAHCIGLSPPSQVFQPKASDTRSRRPHPAAAALGSGAALQLVQAAELEPRGHIQPQPPHPPCQQRHLCKAMALPSQILLQPPSPWRGEAWGRLLGVPTFWGMRGRVRPSSHRGRQRRRGRDAVCVEPPFGGGPRRQVRGQLTHPCCHGEFSPRHRETAAFPQNLTGSVWMLGFSRQWGRTSKCWGVLARCRGAREQHVPSWKVKKMPPWAAVIVLPLPRLGKSQLLPLAVLLLGDHRAGISLGQTWEDMAERKLYFPGGK